MVINTLEGILSIDQINMPALNSPIGSLPVYHFIDSIQSNFNGLNIYGTIETCSRHG